jgi:hypothetical protein
LVSIIDKFRIYEISLDGPLFGLTMFSLTTAGINQLCGAIYTQQSKSECKSATCLDLEFPR